MTKYTKEPLIYKYLTKKLKRPESRSQFSNLLQMTHGDLLAVERVGEASVVGGVEQVPDDGLVATEVPDAEADDEE